MFRKKRQGKNDLDDDVAMRIVAKGKAHDVSFRELLLSMNLTMEALLSLLAKKNIITPEEMLQEIDNIRARHHEKKPPAAAD